MSRQVTVHRCKIVTTVILFPSFVRLRVSERAAYLVRPTGLWFNSRVAEFTHLHVTGCGYPSRFCNALLERYLNDFFKFETMQKSSVMCHPSRLKTNSRRVFRPFYYLIETTVHARRKRRVCGQNQ